MIDVQQVTKYYGAHPAVRDLSFEIAEGECIGFLGLNGAGKSTTLKMLSCLLLPTSGRVTIRGLDVEEKPHEIRKTIGFLPDTPPVYVEMTVAEYVRYAGQLRQMTSAAIEKRMPDVLAQCGLEGVANQPIGTLSHGYRQRVGIAQAIVHSPSLLILDEPIQGLDPVQIVEMREMIRGLRGKHTILLSTHILSEIEQTCDRILMLHQGCIAARGSEDELRARVSGITETGAGRFRLVLAAREPERVDAALASLEGVRVLGRTPLREGEEALLHVDLEAMPARRAAIARAVVEAGLDLLAFEAVRTGLEDIFVQLSREGSKN